VQEHVLATLLGQPLDLAANRARRRQEDRLADNAGEQRPAFALDDVHYAFSSRT
jgi:hypothetical protein